MHGGIANHGSWRKTVVNSYNKPLLKPRVTEIGNTKSHHKATMMNDQSVFNPDEYNRTTGK